MGQKREITHPVPLVMHDDAKGPIYLDLQG